MANYRYLLGDILTGEIAAELPFTSATYSHVLNAPGSFQGTMPLLQPDTINRVFQESFNLGRSTMYVERDGVIVWGGFLWTENVDFDAGTYQVNGEGWHSYFRRRVLTEDSTYAATEQVDIAADLIDWAQAQTGGNIGVETGTVTATGRVRDRTYLGIERKNIGEALEQLAAVIDGFDFRYETAREGDAISINFVTTYPPTGRVTDLVFEAGVQLSEIQATTDATNLATYVTVVGATLENTETPLLAVSSDTERLAVMPRFDDVISETDVSETDTLAEKADLRLLRGYAPICIPSISADPALDPKLGSYREGDVVTVRASVGLRSIDAMFRITEYAVTVGAAGDESASLTLASAEVYEAE